MLEYHHSRRIFHLLPGLVIISISYIIPPYPIGFALLTGVTAIFYYMHIKRTYNRDYDIWYLEQYGKLLREEERGEWMLIGESATSDTKGNGCRANSDGTKSYKRKFYPILPGAFYWLLGTTISSAIFAPDTARTALLVLSVSDPFAAYVGVWFSNNNCNITWSRLWGTIMHNRREKNVAKGPTVVGSLACVVSTLLCTYVYFPNSHDVGSSTPALSLSSRIIVSASTAIVEAVAGRSMLLPVDDNLLIPIVVGGLIKFLEL